MKKEIIKKRLSLFVVCIFLLNLFSCTHLYSYEKLLYWLMYDHIEYNGTPYYIVAESPNLPTTENKVLIVDEIVYVTIVDENGEPYDATRQEKAWGFYAGNSEISYILFNSAYYTKDRALASVHYGFGESNQ